MAIVLKKPLFANSAANLKKHKGWMFKEAKAAKPPKEAKKEHGYSIDDNADFRGWAAQKPDLARVLGVVMSKWRASRTLRWGTGGYWAAWPLDDWCKWTGLERRTLQRKLDELVAIGMVERTPGRHSGSRVLMHYRPTTRALDVSKAPATDWKHLGVEFKVEEKDTSYNKLLDAYKAAYEENTGIPMVAVSAKERKALRTILATLSDAWKLIEPVFLDWTEFTAHVQKAKGWGLGFGDPDSPSASYVEKHLQLALEFLIVKADTEIEEAEYKALLDTLTGGSEEPETPPSEGS